MVTEGQFLERPALIDANGVWLEGTHALLMTEYGIKPRRMMLGTLRVKDRIAVHFRLLLVPGGLKT